MNKLLLTITGLWALSTSVAFLITVTADDLLRFSAILQPMALLTTIVAGSTTTTLRAIAREMTN